MKTPELFKEYIWLVNTIHQAGYISLTDINEKWLQTDMSQGVEMARSTFNRHRVAIEDIFGIIIDCKRRGGYRYYNGRWMMSANIDGKPLPEREVTREDATVFKQDQQTMSDIVLKYYADDLSQPRQHAARNGMGR